MSKHNYSQYSKKNNKPRPEATRTVVAYTDMSTIVEPEEIKMEPITASEPVVLMGPIEVLPAIVPGTVANCNKLNIRENPAADAEVLAVLNAGSELEIDPAKSTKVWLKVTTVSGIEGYCMRKFVDAKL